MDSFDYDAFVVHTRICISGILGGKKALWLGCGEDLNVEKRRAKNNAISTKGASGTLFYYGHCDGIIRST